MDVNAAAILRKTLTEELMSLWNVFNVYLGISLGKKNHMAQAYEHLTRGKRMLIRLVVKTYIQHKKQKTKYKMNYDYLKME